MGAVPDTMFSGEKLTPWHGIGTIVEGLLTAEEALTASGLTWTVSKEPIFNADMQEIPGFFSMTKSDTGKSLGVVGAKYSPIQNLDGFNFVDSIIGSNAAHFTTSGSLYGGKTVFILAKLDKTLYVAGDAIDPYFLLKNTHDGSGALKVLTTPVRVVCQNTLNAAMNGSKRAFSIRHTSGYEDKMAVAQTTLGLTQKYYESFVEFAERLVAEKFTKSAFETLMDTLMPVKGKEGRALTVATRDRDLLMQAYNADDIDNVRGTKWGAYNAVADYSDHMRKAVGDPTLRRENGFVRTWDGTDLKDAALALLVGAN